MLMNTLLAVSAFVAVDFSELEPTAHLARKDAVQLTANGAASILVEVLLKPGRYWITGQCNLEGTATYGLFFRCGLSTNGTMPKFTGVASHDYLSTVPTNSVINQSQSVGGLLLTVTTNQTVSLMAAVSLSGQFTSFGSLNVTELPESPRKQLKRPVHHL
jgi:hypothetical protein